MGIRKAKRTREDDAWLDSLTVPGYSMANVSFAAPPKRKRAKKDPNAEDEEKRLARYKPACPQNIAERVDRVMTQRFFMIDRKREGDALREEFKVLGSTGNVYTVAIDRLPSCDCPDASKGNHCKHILFVFLKVLSVPQSSNLYYQKALLSSELAAIFAAAPRAPNHVSNPRINAVYAKASGSSSKDTTEEVAGKRRLPEEGDDCPICYESMDARNLTTLTFCEECGNGLHKQCFSQWARTAHPLTCVYCRSPWADRSVGGGARASAGVNNEGYLNLAGAVGLSPERDTSTYYNGPRRGQPFYSGYGRW